MASYVCRVQTIQRSAGRSAVAAAAYRSGQALTDERLAMDFDFAAREGVEHVEILAPASAPAAFLDRQTLWNASEKSERRKDTPSQREKSFWRCRTNSISNSGGRSSGPLLGSMSRRAG